MVEDKDVRARVLDITKSFLVQAPAGSGKTAILVQRFLKALAVVKSGPEEIVAITFTRKAAAEMRERILNTLQFAATQPAPNDEYQLMLWQLGKQVLARDASEDWQILSNPARLKIQTIDALCASITKQMPILSRFGAQPQIEQNSEHLYARAVDSLIQSFDHEQNYMGKQALFKLLQYLDNDRIKVKKLLIQMLQKREHWLPTIAKHMYSQNLRSYLEQGLIFACEEAVEDLNEVVPPVLDVMVMGVDEPQSLDEWLSIVDKLLTAEGSYRKTVGVDQGFHPPSKATNKEEKQQLKAAKDTMIAMLDHLRPHEEFRQQLAVLRELPPLGYTEPQWEIVAALIEVLPLLAAQLTVVFRDQGQVDFIAVALSALTALQDQETPTDLSLALDCKIRHILVDEFQDTSHIQFRLLEYLTITWEPHDGRTLFLVGDPMQSIYRFRQAEVGLFLKAKDQGVGNVQLEFAQLRVNFRSTAPIVQWINNVFSHSFPKNDNKTLGAISYMSAVAADKSPADFEAVTCINVDDDSEGYEIVKIIKSTRAENQNCSIAILVRAKSHLFKILPALRSANIPYQGLEIENLSKRPIILDLLSLTRAFLHLDDRIAWFAILRAPWCAATLADLQIIAQYPGTIFAALQAQEVKAQLSSETQLRVGRLTSVMQDSLKYLGRSSIARVVRSAFHNLGGIHCMRDAAEIYEVEAFITLLERVEHKPEVYNPGYLEQELDRLFLEPTNLDSKTAVQIMTMHKSKGLEFDVVILPSLTKSIRHHDQQLLLLEQRDYEHEYLLLAPIRAADQKSDPIYNYLAWCESQREEYETLRQLYVAATRAKRKIYCLGSISHTNKIGGMLEKIWPYISKQFINGSETDDHMPIRTIHLRRLPTEWFGANNEYPAIGISTKKRIIKQWQPNWVNQAGTIMHRILYRIASVGLENLDTEFFATLSQVCKQHMRILCVRQEDQIKALNLILQAVQTMVKDKFGATILSAAHKESYAEWRLSRAVEDQIEHVRLDRVFLDQDDTLWLVDYKLVLDNENISVAIQDNQQQVAKYAQILRQIKPDRKLIAGLYFPLQTLWHRVC